MELSVSRPSFILLWITSIALCSTVPYPSFVSSSFLNYSSIKPRAILPPYSNASSMPLYGPDGRPRHSDIDQVLSHGGWFEAFAAALTDINSTVITDHLVDCRDGTVNVTLFPGSLKPEKTFNVNKRGWGSSTNNISVAWPAALFDGLTKLSLIQNSSQTNTQTVMAQAIVGIYANSTTTSCQIAPAPAPNPYHMTTKAPIIAYMRASADASISSRYLHVMLYNATSENGGDFVSFDTASIPGAGPGTKNLSLSEWDGECLFLSMPPLS